MAINLPETGQERIVIVGAGFAGLTLASKLKKSDLQIVLIDRNNFHQFQPLYYQVAMAGVEPSAISFPLRKMFQKRKNVLIRMADVKRVDTAAKRIHTEHGHVNYDKLVLSMGVTNNFFGNEKIAENALTLKTVSEALYMRNRLLDDLEQALMIRDYEDRQSRIDIVIVGGGPTGVELAGALAEMKKFVIPREYFELDASEIDIYLIQGSDRLLDTMSEKASASAEKFLTDMGVIVRTGIRVVDGDGRRVVLSDGTTIPCQKVLWAAGVTGWEVEGMDASKFGSGQRIKVDEYNRVEGMEDVFALGDQCIMCTDEWPDGHPQVAQGAIQHAKHLAKNLKRMSRGEPLMPFRYKDLGTLATIGRNKAVADLPVLHMSGFIAWILWLVVHLKSILGVKNKIFVLLNWMWDYVFYNQSLRIIIKPKK